MICPNCHVNVECPTCEPEHEFVPCCEDPQCLGVVHDWCMDCGKTRDDSKHYQVMGVLKQ